MVDFHDCDIILISSRVRAEGWAEARRQIQLLRDCGPQVSTGWTISDSSHYCHFAFHEIMVNVLVAWAAKGVAAAYGLFALGLAILYSLSRSDTWRKPTEREQQELQKGTINCQVSSHIN